MTLKSERDLKIFSRMHLPRKPVAPVRRIDLFW